jgi:hypothetical protein
MFRFLRALCPALSLFLLETIVTAGPAPKAIQRLDGTSITEGDLTTRIEDLVKKARVHGMAVSIFNGREAVYSRTATRARA